MKKSRLAWHIFPSHVIIAVVSVVAVAWYSSRVFRQFHYDQTERELKSAACLVSQQIKARGGRMDVAGTDALCDALGTSGYRITVILPSGEVVGDSEKDPATMDNHAGRPEIAAAMRGLPGSSSRYSDTLKMEMLYVAVPLTVDGRHAGVVRASLALSEIEKTLGKMWLRLLVAALILSGLAIVATTIQVRRISGPLTAIRAGAEAFGRGDLAERLPPSDIVEIDVLAQTMNKMADQLNERLKSVTRQRDEQEALLSCMAEAVLAVDNDKCVLRMNQAAEKLFSVNAAACVGRGIAEIVRNADLLDTMDRTLESSGPAEGDIYLSESDRYLQGHGSVLHGEDGRRIGALVVLNDVSRLRKLEMVRRDFVANVSHELKTPITSIKGFAETIIDTPMEEADRDRFMQIIRKQTNRLQTIIDDLLALSSLEHGIEKDEIELGMGNVAKVLRNAVESCRAKADAGSVSLDIDCEEGVAARINTQLLEQAVINLLDNAIKYSGPGTSIEITCKETEQEVVISVRDHGTGIPRQHLGRLFERFYRVDKARSRELGGTGLGLAVVKHISIAHNGHVNVQSRLGEGSTFSLFLPREA